MLKTKKPLLVKINLTFQQNNGNYFIPVLIVDCKIRTGKEQ